MHIVLVNWAKIWDGASHGGGVNVYCQNLALELLRRGHEVSYVCGGWTYVPAAGGPESVQGGGGGVGKCEVRRHEDWLGVRVFEVINSPVLSPSIAQFAEPLAEVSSPELEAQVERLMELLRPDAVHVNNIEGFSAGCIEAMRRGAQRGGGRGRIIFSLHNYHTICPQVYLTQNHRVVCTNYENGHACVGCITTPTPEQTRAERAAAYARSVQGPAAPTQPQPQGPSVLSRLIAEVKERLVGAPEPVAAPAVRIEPPGKPVGEASAVSVRLPVLGVDRRGKTEYLLGELKPRETWSVEDPIYRPVSNAVLPEPACEKPPNEYAQRRAAMVSMLNGCDAVLAVSDFVRDKFIAMGVRTELISTLHIGTRALEVAARHAELLFDPEPITRERPRPVRLVFMGYNNWYKGLSMLADSLELLTAEYLQRIHLSIFALDGHTIEWRFRRMEPRLGGLSLHHGYEYHDLPWMLGGKDLGLVTSVWWDNAPQTVFEFFSCGVPVLGAELGGIPDFVKDGHNGLLFRGNDRYDLARKLAYVVDHPELLTKLRANVRPPKAMDVHAGEMELVYAGDGRERPGSRPEIHTRGAVREGSVL